MLPDRVAIGVRPKVVTSGSRSARPGGLMTAAARSCGVLGAFGTTPYGVLVRISVRVCRRVGLLGRKEVPDSTGLKPNRGGAGSKVTPGLPSPSAATEGTGPDTISIDTNRPRRTHLRPLRHLPVIVLIYM